MYIADAIRTLRRHKNTLEQQLAGMGALYAPPHMITQTEDLQRVITALTEIQELHARGENMQERLGNAVRFCQSNGFPVGSIELVRDEEEDL